MKTFAQSPWFKLAAVSLAGIFISLIVLVGINSLTNTNGMNTGHGYTYSGNYNGMGYGNSGMMSYNDQYGMNSMQGMQGNMQGMMQGNMQGMNGNMQGNMQGSMNGGMGMMGNMGMMGGMSGSSGSGGGMGMMGGMM